MGLGRRTMGIGNDLNPNVKGDASVKTFTVSAGLDVQGFTQYLSGLVSHGHELAKLSNSEWAQILGPMELAGERAARVQKAIGELRTKAAQEAAESDEKNMHNHIVNGGAHPHARPGAEVYEPKLNGARPKAADYQSFIPVAFFQGEKQGWTFKHGDEGLGYYRDASAASAKGAAAAAATPVVTNLARGINPISQAGLEDQMMASQQRAYSQSKQQQLLIERRRRMDEQQSMYSQGEVANMYADARLRSSPFATGY